MKKQNTLSRLSWLRKAINFSVVLLVTYACVHDPFPLVPPPIEVNPGNNYGGTTPDCKYVGVCFESSVLPIFQSSCARTGCHDASGITDYNLTTYETIMRKGIVPGSATSSKLWQVTGLQDEDNMPPPPNAVLTTAQRDSIAKWINEGAKNTTKCNCSCDTTKFTFAATINPLMTAYCAGCHNPNSAGGNIILTTYSGVQAVALNNKLMGSITHSTGYKAMPQGGKLSSCQITQIQKWVDAGTLNN